MLLAKANQLLCLLDRVIFSGHTAHIAAVVQHRKDLALQTPSLVLREMPMKYVHLVAGKYLDLPFQFFHGDIAPPYVLHESSYAESRPVGDLATLDGISLPLPLGQLAQGLYRPISSLLGYRPDGYPPGRDA